MREFTHVVMDEDMLMIYLNGIIGERLVAKKHCLLETVDGAGPSIQSAVLNWHLQLSCQTGFGSTKQRLFLRFDTMLQIEDGLTRTLIRGNAEFPPLIGQDSPLVKSSSP